MCYQVEIQTEKRIAKINGSTYTIEQLRAKKDRTQIESEILKACESIFKEANIGGCDVYIQGILDFEVVDAEHVKYSGMRGNNSGEE